MINNQTYVVKAPALYTAQKAVVVGVPQMTDPEKQSQLLKVVNAFKNNPNLQQMAGDAAASSAKTSEAPAGEAPAEEERVPIPAGIDEENVNQVMANSDLTWNQAVEALVKSENDPVNALLM